MNLKKVLLRCIVITIFVIVIGRVIGFIDSDIILPILSGAALSSFVYILLYWHKD